MSVDLKPGDRFLDRFRVEFLIAEGGMASIYAARDELTSHQVALKVLYPYYSDNTIIRARFLEEGRIQQQLRHPNIVRVFQVQDVPFLAILMEYVEGPTLDDFLTQNGHLSTEQVIDVIIPCMSAVGLAHSQGVIHRDLKPSNILISDGDLSRPKVLDFGVAKIKGSRHDLTATGTTVGTLHYMSPEQIVGSKSIDGRADIYSIGVMIYKLVTGEVPFNAPTEFALMMAQVEAPPLPPSKLRPDIHSGLERVILKAMEKRPQDRFQTIRDFTQALLDLEIANKTATVGDTVNARISSELLAYAINADEIAVDRFDDGFSRTERIEVSELPMDLATIEIEATLKIQRPNDATAELSNSAVVRISRSEMAQIEAEQDTAAIPRLKNHPREDETKLTPPAEVERLIKSTRSNEVIKDDSLAVRRTMPSSSPDDIANPNAANVTRPSKPSALVKQSGQNLLEPQTQPLEPEDFETVSIARPLRGSELDEISDALRQGVLVADPHIDSRDLTAPKMSRDDLKQYLPQSGRQPAPTAPSERQGEPLGPAVQQRIPPADASKRTSGPKLVLGKNYADTSERTREKPASLVQQNMIQNSDAQGQLRSGYQVSPINPQEDGRMHQPVQRNVHPTAPPDEPNSNVPQRPASNLPSPQPNLPFAQQGAYPTPLQQAPKPPAKAEPEINTKWLMLGLLAFGVIVAAFLVIAGQAFL